ncbi:hypothetical protein ACRYCC_07285 [Actinomadura scrupuli]
MLPGTPSIRDERPARLPVQPCAQFEEDLLAEAVAERPEDGREDGS